MHVVVVVVVGRGRVVVVLVGGGTSAVVVVMVAAGSGGAVVAVAPVVDVGNSTRVVGAGELAALPRPLPRVSVGAPAVSEVVGVSEVVVVVVPAATEVVVVSVRAAVVTLTARRAVGRRRPARPTCRSGVTAAARPDRAQPSARSCRSIPGPASDAVGSAGETQACGTPYGGTGVRRARTAADLGKDGS